MRRNSRGALNEKPLIHGQAGEMTTAPDFDVALSFASEDRANVDAVAHALHNQGVKVFYDIIAEDDRGNKNLYINLSDLHQKRARFTVVFISKAYSDKLWTDRERRAAQTRSVSRGPGACSSCQVR